MEISNSIKLVAFDLEGVLFDWHSGLNYISLISGKPTKEIHKYIKNFIPKLEIGEMTLNDLWTKLIQDYDLNVTNEDLMGNWINSHQKIEKNWKLATECKDRGLTIVVCSNCWAGLMDLFRQKFPEFEIFDQIFDSSKIGFVKPNENYFKFIEEKTGFSGSQILFIDDSLNNLNGAQKLGWNVFLNKI